MARHVRVTLRYQGVDYSFTDTYWSDATSDADAMEYAEYQFTEGNYSCDCNRMLFIDQHCEDAPEFPVNDDGDHCGTTIDLVSLIYVDADGNERTLYPPPEFVVWDSSGGWWEAMAPIHDPFAFLPLMRAMDAKGKA